MKSEVKKLPQSVVEILVEISVDELQPYLVKAAEKISQTAKIEGFRPGKAPYEIILAKFGEMAILQEAVDSIISKTYYDIIKENKLVTIGQPKIDLEKVAPGNPFSYKATVSVLPEVKLGELSKIKIKQEEIKITDEQVNKLIEEIRSMRAKEEKVDRAVKKGDLVKFDFDVFRDGVPIENGSSKNYSLVIGENRFIPGFEDNLTGLKAEAEKEFKLKFPENYHEKSLAGKPAEFKVKINEVCELIKPELTDELAKEVSGGKTNTVNELKTEIKANLTQEETNKQEQRIERELLEEACKISDFEELPEVLIEEELHRMMNELQHSISQQGMDFNNYLTSIKKTEEDLRTELKPQAELRAKSAIVARAIYQEQKLTVTDEEVAEEITKMLQAYGNHPDAKKQLETENYKEYLKNMLGNRKVIAYLKSIILK